MAATTMKDAACMEIDRYAADLNEISQTIWEKPELYYEEINAHQVLTDFLEKHGFKVERNYKLNTAFRAVFGQDGIGPHVAVLCEYDALPEIGHACGHNLIAEVGVAAGLGVKAALQATGKGGKLTVLGTPAEEDGGGKLDLINANVFNDVDVAMMAHPSPYVTACPLFLAVVSCTIKFHGKSSHAAGFPWNGINALDAAVLCYQNISCLRQQMRPDWRVHGIIKKGGVKANVIPEVSELAYSLRTPTDKELNVLKEKVSKCIEAAASATGCTVEYEFDPKEYSNVVTNRTLANAFVANAKVIGVEFTQQEKLKGVCIGSTDMGNVSYVVPSIHPIYYVGVKDCLNHTREFTAAAGSPEAQPYTLDIGKALAMTAVDVYTSQDIQAEIYEDFSRDMNY
ncbi:peptidase M20 domain-containing protein 2-like [Haliotis rufescens]|uniref:peptidase M20 domain-containing protein 2-like n=1 Tax=Haliotis rufescens TaxID=6454 RepID=UPI00201EA165|nr:peptidase M20 domain-containing protein 2-like [Haliotis rufescens]